MLRARPVSDSKAVELTVANDGKPIAPESRAFIFEKYAQVASNASVNRGLGLYFCRVAVEAHGGRIDLVNDPQIATCFRIELPQT